MKLHFVESMDEVLMVALEKPLEDLSQAPPPEAIERPKKSSKGVTH
jgi:hypothetical protein